MVLSPAGERPERYTDIVVAAQQLFGEVGYEKTGVREIAERAHIAIRTLYSYFPDGKSGVLTAALDDCVGRLVEHVSQAGESDPLEAFLSRARRLNSEIVRDPFLRRLFVDGDRMAEPRLRERGREIVRQIETVAVTELQRLAEAGLARCEDVEAVAVLLRVSNVGWIMTQSTGGQSVDHERFLDTLIAAVRALISPA